MYEKSSHCIDITELQNVGNVMVNFTKKKKFMDCSYDQFSILYSEITERNYFAVKLWLETKQSNRIENLDFPRIVSNINFPTLLSAIPVTLAITLT